MPDEKEYQEIKAGVEGMVGEVPAPSTDEVSNPEIPETAQLPETNYASSYNESSYNQQQPQNYVGGQIDMDKVHELIEAIISEKWQDIAGGIGNLAVWKEKTNNDVIAIKQELIRLGERFEQLQNAVLGKIKDYDEGIRSVHTEMKALEKVFERILEPLTSNIKELSSITQDLKKVKR